MARLFRALSRALGALAVIGAAGFEPATSCSQTLPGHRNSR